MEYRDEKFLKLCMKKPLLVVALVGLAVVAILAATVLIPLGSKAPQHALRPDDAQMLVAGERIYVAQCAACHGAKLEGQPDWRTRDADGMLPAPPHDASGHTWHHPDELLFNITKFGVASVIGDPSYKTAMPAYGATLNDKDIVAVLSWIKSQWPEDTREQHDQMNEEAINAARP